MQETLHLNGSSKKPILKMKMKSRAKKKATKTQSEHRLNGLIAELRAVAPEADKALITRANKASRKAVEQAKAAGPSLLAATPSAKIQKLLSNR